MSSEPTIAAEIPTFWFEEIAPFNARGLRRCLIPGCGISGTNYGTMNADFWRGRNKQVLVRFSWAGYSYHYGVAMPGGAKVPDASMDALLGHVEEILLEWYAEAPDVPPDMPPDELQEGGPMNKTLEQIGEEVSKIDFTDPKNQLSEEEFKKVSEDRTPAEEGTVITFSAQRGKPRRRRK